MKLALLTGLLLTAPAVQPFQATDDHDAPVAVARDMSLSRAEFGEWLVERVGMDHATNFLVERLAVREAERLSVAPDAAAVEAAWESERDMSLVQHFHGDMAAYLDDLRRRGFDPEAWIERRKRELAADLALVNLARMQRVVSEEDLLQHFSDVYGDLQERTTLEILFISMYRGATPGTTDLPALRESSLKRAEDAAEQLAAGRAIAELLPLGDKVNSDFVHAGRIAPYRRRMLGKEVEKAQSLLDEPGQVSPPISVFDGYYVLRLVGREPVTLDSVRDELQAVVRDAHPTSSELLELRDKLLAEQEAKVLLR